MSSCTLSQLCRNICFISEYFHVCYIYVNIFIFCRALKFTEQKFLSDLQLGSIIDLHLVKTLVIVFVPSIIIIKLFRLISTYIIYLQREHTTRFLSGISCRSMVMCRPDQENTPHYTSQGFPVDQWQCVDQIKRTHHTIPLRGFLSINGNVQTRSREHTTLYLSGISCRSMAMCRPDQEDKLQVVK